MGYRHYCLKFRKNKESKNQVARTKNGMIMLLSNWVVFDSKKPKFMKHQEVSRLLSSLGIITPFIRKLNKRKVHSLFIDNILGTDLADMQLISKFNKGFGFLLCLIDIYSKYPWVIPLKDKKGITIINFFQKYLK